MRIILHISLLLRAGLSLRKIFLRLLWSLECCRARGLAVVFYLSISLTNCCHIYFYSRYERQKLNQTQPLMSLEKFMDPKSVLCQRALLYTGILSHYVDFFSACWKGTGQRGFLSAGMAPGLTSFQNSSHSFMEIVHLCFSRTSKHLLEDGHFGSSLVLSP